MKIFLVGLLALMVVACGSSEQSNSEKKEVNVYSHRHYEADKKLFDKFTEETGIKVNVIKAGADELIMRLKSEGKNSPADLLITVDSGRLERAKSEGILQPIPKETILENVPERYRDTEFYWTAISSRARVIVYDESQLEGLEPPKNYEDLADKKYHGKIVMRSSENIYNQSLLASMILHVGKGSAQQWAEGVVANLAANPKGGDRDQVKYIASGEGAISIVNDYYLSQMMNSTNEAEKEAVSGIQVVFPNQGNRGTHVNISGVGLAKYAKNMNEALQLIEFLTNEYAQEVLVVENHESAVNPKVTLRNRVFANTENIKLDTIHTGSFGAINRDAVMIFDKAGWK